RALDSLERLLDTAGSSLRDVVHADVYYGHPRDLPQIEEAWRERFADDPPARTIVPYTLLEGRGPQIAVVALRREGATRRQAVMADAVPEPIYHEPHAMRAGDLLFFSTQIAATKDGLCPGGRRDPNYPYYGLPSRAQMRFVMENVARICEAAGTT